jgi:hypothetical protein
MIPIVRVAGYFYFPTHFMNMRPLMIALLAVTIIVVITVAAVLMSPQSSPVPYIQEPIVYAPQTENQADDYQLEDYQAEEQTSEEAMYNKASELTTMRFSRSVDKNGLLTQEADFTITGYLQEVKSNYDRKFVLEDGSLEWSLEEHEDDGDPKCNWVTHVESSGKESLSALDVYIETSGEEFEMEGYGMVSVEYNSDNPKIVFKTQLQIPIEVANSLTVTDPSPNVHAICNGQTESGSSSYKTSAQFNPILTIKNPGFSGSLVTDGLDGMKFKVLSDYDAALDFFMISTPIHFSADDGSWQVSWEINLPD